MLITTLNLFPFEGQSFFSLSLFILIVSSLACGAFVLNLVLVFVELRLFLEILHIRERRPDFIECRIQIRGFSFVLKLIVSRLDLASRKPFSPDLFIVCIQLIIHRFRRPTPQRQRQLRRSHGRRPFAQFFLVTLVLIIRGKDVRLDRRILRLMPSTNQPSSHIHDQRLGRSPQDQADEDAEGGAAQHPETHPRSNQAGQQRLNRNPLMRWRRTTKVVRPITDGPVN